MSTTARLHHARWRSLALLVFACVALPASAGKHVPITKQLQGLIEHRPDVGDLLAQSIAAAAKVNPDPDPKTNLVQIFGPVHNGRQTR